MIATLQWLGIVPSFSRPHVCNDHPYSEALFRTLKHTPAYPRLPFASRDAVRQWVTRVLTSPSSRVAGPSVNTPGAGRLKLVRQDSKLGTRARRGTQSRAHGRGSQCGILISATTTLTLPLQIRLAFFRFA